MGFVKVVKNKSYFKRYQVKFARRRAAKTDYYARRRLILQDKNKYRTPRYRFVVRRTKRDIICQIFSADLTHDVCVASAYSHELRRYGARLGLTNYAAAYATGLLLARRVNVKFNLDYEGQTDVDGEDYIVEPDSNGKAPFRAVLDVGLHRTTTGARLFGALKGACDGGLNVPHNPRRFPGTTKDGKEYKPNPEVHKKYIFAGHVADWMRELAGRDDDTDYQRQFGRYIRAKLDADKLEAMWRNCHKAIRADPNKPRSPLERGYFCEDRKKPKPENATYPAKQWRPTRRSAAQRYARIKQKLAARGVQAVVDEFM